MKILARAAAAAAQSHLSLSKFPRHLTTLKGTRAPLIPWFLQSPKAFLLGKEGRLVLLLEEEKLFRCRRSTPLLCSKVWTQLHPLILNQVEIRDSMVGNHICLRRLLYHESMYIPHGCKLNTIQTLCWTSASFLLHLACSSISQV